MSLSMYQASVPTFIHMLKNLSSILAKAVAHAEAKKIDPSVLLNARLAPDMFSLTRQVQIAADIIKNGSARLAGVAIPSFPDTETSFPELQERLAKTIAFLESLTAAQIDGSEERTITMNMEKQPLNFNGQTYMLAFIYPNFYFHLTTAYAILRHNGVDVGKMDFLGKIQ